MYSFQDHGKKCPDKDSFKTIHQKSGKSVLSRPSNDGSRDDTSFKTIGENDQKSTPFRTIANRVKNLNPRYMVPIDEVSQTISDPKSRKKAQPVTEQLSSGPPPPGSRFKPIYVEPGSVSINSTRDLQALFPNSFDCIGDMQGEYDIKTDPIIPPVQHGRQKVPIKYKEEIKKEPAEMVWQGIIIKQTGPTPWVSSLTYPKKANGKLRICLYPKDLNKAIIHGNHKAPTLEEIAHVLTGATHYANIERELLAIIHGCGKFHMYLYGRTFIVEMDHKPLEMISLKNLTLAPACLQRVLLHLQQCDLVIMYQPRREMFLADALSCLPSRTNTEIKLDLRVNTILMFAFTPRCLTKIRAETQWDPILSMVHRLTLNGWPDRQGRVPRVARFYWNFHNELSINGDILTKGE